MARGVEELSIFTRELFSTPHDTANRAAVAGVPAAELDLVGIALRADSKIVDKVPTGCDHIRNGDTVYRLGSSRAA